MNREDLLDLIWDAGFRPVERNTRYEVVHEYDPAPSLAERRAAPDLRLVG
jgi:aminodeoxyfutalosine synthase